MNDFEIKLLDGLRAFDKATVLELMRSNEDLLDAPGYEVTEMIHGYVQNEYILQIEEDKMYYSITEKGRSFLEQAKAEKQRQTEEKRIADEKLRRKRKAKIAVPISGGCAIIAFIIVLYTVIIPNNKYNDAIALMDAGKLDEAYDIFHELNNYRDSAEQAGNIRLTKIKEQLQNVKVGDTVSFGVYEQDNDTSNGKETVEWLVLDVKEGKALLISKYILDCQAYHATYPDSDVRWETCSLRKWLNEDFINATFTANEKAIILTETVYPVKKGYGFDPERSTQDKVFLLSKDEARKYFDGTEECIATDYAYSRGDIAGWWLRSPSSQACFEVMGRPNVKYVADCDGVRPALWIDLSEVD